MCFDENVVRSSQSSQCDSCGAPSRNEYEDFILCEFVWRIARLYRDATAWLVLNRLAAD